MCNLQVAYFVPNVFLTFSLLESTTSIIKRYAN